MGSFLLGAVRLLLIVRATQATVVGTVRDGSNGEPIVGAVVTLTDLGRSAATDQDGRYLLRDVPAGAQHLSVRFIGYSARTLHALVPPAGELEINVSLRPKPVWLPPISVRPPIAVRGVDPGDSAAYPDRGASLAAVGSSPLLSEPDVFEALDGGEVVLTPESPSGVHVRGGGSDQTGYLLDGIPILNPYHAAGMFSAWNPDALSGVDLSSSAPSPAYPDALSGTIAGVTRTPDTRLHARGGTSTTQARLSFDGPLGFAGAGFLVSVRWGFPGSIAPRNESSYLKTETGDRLAKLELPAFRGQLRLLGYDSENEISAQAAAPAADSTAPDPRRNGFSWRSRSVGAGWRRTIANNTVGLSAWSAVGAANSDWAARVAPVELQAARRDVGALATVELRTARAATVLGLRVERSRTSYGVASDSGAGLSLGLNASTVISTAFAEHRHAIGDRMGLTLGASLAMGGGDTYLGPRAQLRWQASNRLALSASYARLHQFSQSLRNPESVVGNVFPVDLYVGAGAAGVPVARSDQGVIAFDYRPAGGIRLGVQGYQRSFAGVVLVAPEAGEPFSTGPFVVGSGVSRGVSVDGAVSAQHWGLVASYGLQQVRLDYGGGSYVPEYGATQLFEGGLIVFPTASTSLRLGLTGAAGRRTTPVSGGFEWEACNLLDQGCEFRGSPHTDGEPLGATRLPDYLRLDLGFRKQWHIAAAGRDAVLALFGTATNVLGRINVLTYSRDVSTGNLVPVEMRPMAPLVVGLDWRF